VPAENAGRAFALVLVDELARHGVRQAVVAPGSRSTPIALALIEHPAIDVHVRIDERSAAYLALGIAKASGGIVPVLCTSGTATSHFHGAVLEADLARVPLLVLTADRPPELRGIGANQTIDQVGLYGGAVRWAAEVDVPDAGADRVAGWRSLVETAAAHCTGAGGSPAGPVHLNLPLREPLTPVDDGIGFPDDLGLGREQTPAPAGTTETAAGAGAGLAELFRDVRCGVVVAGGFASADPAGVTRFAERMGWPLIAEPHSGVRYGGNTLRASDPLLRDPGFTTANRPDLVLVIGRVGLSRALLDWLATVRHVVISPDGGNWDVTRTAEQVLTAPVDTLAEIALDPAEPAWVKTWLDASAEVSDAIDAVLDASSTLTEPQVARDVAALVPERTALVVASSMPIRDLDLVMHPREQVHVYANRGVSGIDGFASTAQGVAIAHGDLGPTVALCGDLSLLHDSNGLLPGPDRRPDVTYVVINNDGGGIFSLLPQGSSVDPASFERLFGTPHRLSLERFAAAYQIDYTMVTTRAELATALASGGERIIEVRTDRVANAVLHSRLRDIAPRGGPPVNV
jgi:2-succinyl-5-enolpyruvyl-6-hydroxy-3-cyclohexene-1-carboxylate synthase